ncbi:hypothetical protein GQ44DRAFT_816194 [Phaeosphaeriaceae sp. PMI808]|nr:hypothetical protein GQ44DRAFT_816194 [Phaeosphaeriaceae sp. PMI808]
MYKTISSLGAIAALVATTTTCGVKNGIIISSVYTNGFKLDYYYTKKYSGEIPEHIGWYVEDLNNGFVEPNAFGTADIIYYKSTSPKGSSDPMAKVAAGGIVEFY